MRFIEHALCGGSILAFAISAPASAQEQAEPQEIIVTAMKRESTVLKTPAALSVLAGDALKDQGVNSAADLQNVVPNVNISTGRDGLQVAIRGVSSTDTSSKGSQDIAYNIDGAYVGRGFARSGAFFDIGRVEVLRGPQGTLYGRSSTGGAVNVVTNAPKLDAIEGYARLEYGNFDAKRGEAAFNLPLSDIAALRVSGTFNDRDGYSKPMDTTIVDGGQTYSFDKSQARARNDQKDAAGRVSLLIAPGDAFEARLTATVGHQGGAGSTYALESQLQAHNDTGTAALRTLTNPVPAYLDADFQIYDASIKARAGGIQFDLLGSYQNFRFRQQGTQTNDVAANANSKVEPTFSPTAFGPAFQFYLQRSRSVTKQIELRASNENPGFIDYVVGANLYEEKNDESGLTWNAQIDAPLDQSQYYYYAGPVNTTTQKSYGVFGQATVNVSDRLGVVGGLRYTGNKLVRVGTFTLPFNFGAGFPPPPYPDDAGNAICTYPNDCVGGLNNGREKDHKLTWRLGVNFQATPTDLVYASVSTGFKPGGFNDYDPTVGGIGNYKPAYLTAYEIGYKGRPLSGLTLSSSAFYYDYSDYQVNSIALFPNGQQALFTDVVPVQIYGLENEASYALGPQTTLSTSFSLLHSEYKNFVTGVNRFVGNGIDFSGAAVDLAPKVFVTAAFDHAFDVGSDARIKLHGGIKYSGAYYLSDFGDGVRYRQKGYTRSDANITYEVDGGRYSLQAFVENIENKVQRTSFVTGSYFGGSYGGVGNNAPGALPDNYLAFYTTAPRMYGVRLAYKF
ncbi:TonB-dependent receptor [Novosphingobium resinovorum]|uniref:TonB-dependent receptor n=1 Tax=Novosphingobium resinovorum TaxID=158500 RepID=UPI002ED29C8F|nr:TonB-dependent receptor [Novosphingobium resinovorum]